MKRHYVATLDTGGISYSGQVFVALGETPEQAKAATVREAMGGRPAITTGYGERLVTVAQVEEYYGIRVYGPLADGEAVVE